MSNSGHNQSSSHKIEEDVAKALSLLQQLTDQPQQASGAPVSKVAAPVKQGMPLNEVHFCQAGRTVLHGGSTQDLITSATSDTLCRESLSYFTGRWDWASPWNEALVLSLQR